MGVTSDSADHIVHSSIKISESAAKLAAIGAKNLAALLLAVLRDQERTKGKTGLQTLLKQGKELRVVKLKIDDLSIFRAEAVRYGVLFTSIRERKSSDGLCDVLVRAEDVAKVNRILERIGYTELKQDTPAKNGEGRAPSGRTLSGRGSISGGKARQQTSSEPAKEPPAPAAPSKLDVMQGAAKAGQRAAKETMER